MKLKYTFMSSASLAEEQLERETRARLSVIRSQPKVASTGAVGGTSWEVWDGTKLIRSGFDSSSKAQHYIDTGEVL